MEPRPPLAGRQSELQILKQALAAGGAGRGSLLLLSGPAGIGKTRLLEEAAAAAKEQGIESGTGVALMESFILYHAWNEALRALHLDHLMHERAPPRLQGLYLVSEQGLPVARAERPGFSEDPALLSMMLNNATEFVRDAIPAGSGQAEGNLLRLATGERGVVIARSRSAGLIAVYEGRETEIFLREVEGLLQEVTRAAGARLDGWDGNKRAVADLAEPLVEALRSGSYDGVDQAADAQARRYNLFDNVLFGIRRRAAKGPLLIVLDDLQWADAASLALMHYIARNTRDAPVVIVGAFRSEERDTRVQLRDALVSLAREDLGQEVPLRRLSAGESRQFAEGLLGGHEIAGAFFERLAEQTDGNPLIMREVLRQLRGSGVIVDGAGGGGLQLTRPVDRLEVPGRIRDAVAARVATLEAGERELVDAAAVCGTTFRGEMLAAVVKEAELGIARRLSSIARAHGVIVPDGDGWRFEHPVVREVVYAAIPGEFRRLLHREAGEVLAATGGDGGLIGEHFAEARDGRGLPYLRQAASDAVSRGAPWEAAHLLEKAAQVAQGSELAALEVARAEALEHAGQYGEALAATARARSLGADPVQCALLQSLMLHLQGKHSEVLPVVDSAVPIARGNDRRRLHTRRARALLAMGQPAEAEKAARMALDDGPSPDARTQADALVPLGMSEWHRGRNERALEILNEALRLRESAGDRRGVAEVLVGIGGILGDAGQPQRALEFLRLALAVNERIGDRRGAATCRSDMASALFDLGDTNSAFDEARRAFQAHEKIGNPRGMAWAECVMGMVLARRGQARGALAEMDRCIRRARRQGELRLLVMALSASVGPRIRAGELGQAEDDAREALSVARGTGLRLYEALALRALGEAATARKEFDAMEGHFAKALDLFVELGNSTEEAETHVRWADGLQEARHASEARTHLLRAEAIFNRRDLRRRAALVRTSIVALPS